MLVWLWRFWKMYVNQKFLNKYNEDCILLEIKLPREIFKTPLATEMAINSLLQTGGIGNWYARDFGGALPHYASLEIASLEGEIHFYVRAHKKFREIIEGNFYAHYPGIEIVKADDYTKKIRYHHLSKDVKMWGASYKLSKTWNPVDPETGKAFPHPTKKGSDKKPEKYDMPADFYPIKTYVDYGLDKPGKEEEKIDPIAGLLETMGGIGKGEYFWYQVILQDEGVYDGKKFPQVFVNETNHKHFALKNMAQERKEQIRSSGWNIEGEVSADEFGVPKIIDSFNDKYEQQFEYKKDKDGNEIKVPIKVLAKHLKTKQIFKKEVDLTPEEKDEIELINRKMSKPLALTVVRLMYVTRGAFNANHINTILGFGKPFKGENGLGGCKLSGPYNFDWEDLGKRRSAWRSEEIFEEYVEREGFYPHIPERKALDKMEDELFYPFSMKSRKMFRMIYEGIFHPFDHPHPDQTSVMNLEEIATLWHLPGQVVNPPTLPRIDSVKGTAPSNLPI